MTTRTKAQPIWTALQRDRCVGHRLSNLSCRTRQWCTRDNGRLGRVPCVARAAASGTIGRTTSANHDTARKHDPPPKSGGPSPVSMACNCSHSMDGFAA